MAIPTIIVPVLSKYDYLEKMISTIDYNINQLIIIDNGSNCKKITNKYINKISIVKLPYNLGIATSYNLGIKLSPMSKYWVFAQDDMEWKPGGLEQIDRMSGPNKFLYGLTHSRPFSCRSIGENVISKVGLLDESYYPAPGDEFNFHRRCLYHEIEEGDISKFYKAHNSLTMIEMLKNKTIDSFIWNKNYQRSISSKLENEGWSLKRRREHPEFPENVFNEFKNISLINTILVLKQERHDYPKYN